MKQTSSPSGAVHTASVDDTATRNDQASPRLPHERDQATGDLDPSVAHPAIEQGFKDVQAGLQDTDLRVAMDQINDKDVNPDTHGADVPKH